MKHYHKIWVPEKSQGIAFRDKNGDTPWLVCGPVIVLSLEELRECFKWGMSSFEDTQTPDQSFNDFLQSKGIKIVNNGE